MTYRSAPPRWLANIPSNLLDRRGDPTGESARATALLRYCDEDGYHPTFLDLDRERERRARLDVVVLSQRQQRRRQEPRS